MTFMETMEMSHGNCANSDRIDAFWGEIAPPHHSVQIYASDEVFLDTLAGFVSSGLRSGESVIVIATAAHRYALEKVLTTRGFDLSAASADDHYIALDARETLHRFMVNDWPDAALFWQCVAELLGRARKNGRRVRAFGEMVAMLWAQGRDRATLQLEYLWEQFCHQEAFCLFCAYPQAGFTKEVSVSMAEICAAHSEVLSIP